MESLKTKQAKILKRIHKRKPTEEPPAEGILNVIKDHTKENAIYSMGDFGRKLRNFAKHVDLNHPDLKKIFDGQLVGGGKFSTDAIDLLKLSTYGKTWGLSSTVRSTLKRTVTAKKIYKTLNENIESPSMNLRHIRFLDTRAARNMCRVEKRAQTVSLGSLYSRNNWHDFADNFDNFWFDKSRYESDIKEAKKKHKRLSDNGLSAMSGEIQSSIDEMEKQSVDLQYMGFNRISLISASVILAKMMGYVYEDGPVCHIPDGLIDGQEKCCYAPRAYTYREFFNFAPSGVSELIDYLEEYPPISGRALFDHYRILVPGGAWKGSSSLGNYSGSSSSDGSLYFPDVSLSQKEMDETLIQEGKITAVLLGERDGDHYFISYWM